MNILNMLTGGGAKDLVKGVGDVIDGLHTSEEEKLVTRILEMSGITIRDASLSQAANADKINTKTDQLD